MMVKVRFFARLREVTEETEVPVESREGTTVGEILAELSERYGRTFNRYIYGEDRQIVSHLQILIDGRSITNLQGLETRVKDKARIDIIPLIAGGYKKFETI